jgi:hypothetical protein
MNRFKVALSRLAWGVALNLLPFVALSQIAVTTYHNDNLRTGLNPNETVLTPAKVNSTKFGLLFSLPVDVPAVAIPKLGTHNVIYVATQHNSVYAFDADSNLGASSTPLWHVNLGPSVPNGDVNSDDINPEIGITSTPVIWMRTNAVPLLYVIAKTKTMGANGPVYALKLHALSIADGTEQLSGPLNITATVPGTGDASVNGNITFNPLIQNCRPALLLVQPPTQQTTSSLDANGLHSRQITNQAMGVSGIGVGTQQTLLYAAFASHGDNGPYHGWLFTFDAAKLKLLNVLNTTPNGKTDPSGYPIAAGGIWQGGCGPASDGTKLYFATGNGSFNPSVGSYGDSVLKVTGNGKSILDYFTPSDQLTLDDYDLDLGAGGVMLLPPAASGTSGLKLMVHSGKEGSIYLLNTANLGKSQSTDKVVQELQYVMGGIWGAPAYFNNTIYYGPQYSPLVSFPIANGKFTATSPSSYSPTYFNFPGPTPSVSANGTTNGIVWAIDSDNFGTNASTELHAYDARNLATELYNSSSTLGRDDFAPSVKFTTPTVANGKVFVGAAGAVGVYGFGVWPGSPTALPSGGSYANSVEVKLADTTVGAVIHYTVDGTTPTTSSPTFSAQIKLTTSTTLKAKAFLAGTGSAVVESDYLINSTVGTGTGLTGNYYNNSQSPGGGPTTTQIDPLINFNWNGNSPTTNVAGTNWAGEWTGEIQPETTGTYTLTTNSDDGVQVSINGQLIINDFTYHGPTLDSATYSFNGGQKYSIDIKYFQGGGGSVLQLFWAAPGLPIQIVPTSQLYPK